VAGCCECGNERLGSIKCGEFLDWLRNCWLLKKASAPWSLLLSYVLVCSSADLCLTPYRATPSFEATKSCDALLALDHVLLTPYQSRVTSGSELSPVRPEVAPVVFRANWNLIAN
jgi:hypothetical protein